ncbi:SLC13 family permease [Geotoga petraea]|uniref:Citrate transporter n=1 Tax=Geotoga petraea TaxID=28234 RepID=A0A4Z0VW29_9BACT|nr:ArsB/NhaD family transporter [Geotoga petraea]TGG88211.1 citrate transporter [Geotoga petraea]
MQQIISILVFLITLILIVSHKINRTIAAMLGATLLIIFNIFPTQMYPFEHYLDFNTIFLLLGMMVFVNAIKKSKIFTFFGIKALSYFGKNGVWLFLILTALVAITSSIIDNVTTILIFIPITLAITDTLKIDYFPYILGEIMASNIGGASTIIGDPPNIMIASAANFSFSEFFGVMFPVAVFNLISMDILLIFIFRKQLIKKFQAEIINNMNKSKIIEDKKRFRLSLILLITVIIAFIFQHQLGVESSIIALFAGFFALLIMEPNDIQNTIKEVEWESILFFIGLFVVTGGLEETGVLNELSMMLVDFAGRSAQLFSSFLIVTSGILSGFVDNIPYTATMIPVVANLKSINSEVFTSLNPQWYSLALGACLGGNLTPIGASANIIGIALIKQFKGDNISFKKFFFYGFMITLMTLFISTIYINIRYFF